jgi:hypothetical protein
LAAAWTTATCREELAKTCRERADEREHRGGWDVQEDENNGRA